MSSSRESAGQRNRKAASVGRSGITQPSNLPKACVHFKLPYVRVSAEASSLVVLAGKKFDQEGRPNRS